MLFLNVTANLGFISQLSTIAKNLYPVMANLTPQEATQARDTAGAFVVAIASIFNGLGRLFWAWLSDGIGRKLVFSIMFLSQAVLYLIIPHISNYYVFMIIASYLLGCLGGGFATMPAFTADTFGSAHIGRIYGTMLIAWGSAGVVGPLIFTWIQETTGSYNLALYVAMALLFIGFILTRMYKRPSLPKYHMSST
ncbi:MFS transporter [Geminocystis herdmanii]|uniref:MFS transporter n=1 Tax=Geminocystis herdmanii TaxID=669359 RepID=UPI00034B2936|nr:MFS transporter [Geminocystis herdmanii]